MSDIREAILARLVEVVAATPNIRTVIRNNVDWVDRQMPIAVVLDGDEDVVAGNINNRPSNRPVELEMTPQITIIDQADVIGSDLTAFRAALMKLVLNDATLNEQVTSNGDINYLGCETSFGWLEKQYGALQIKFMFKYWLKPNEL